MCLRQPCIYPAAPMLSSLHTPTHAHPQDACLLLGSTTTPGRKRHAIRHCPMHACVHTPACKQSKPGLWYTPNDGTSRVQPLTACVTKGETHSLSHQEAAVQARRDLAAPTEKGRKTRATLPSTPKICAPHGSQNQTKRVYSPRETREMHTLNSAGACICI